MAELIELVERGIQLVDAGDRPDLRRRLEQTIARMHDPSVRVVVVGEFKQGKSQLINALVNAPVCPVDDDIATSVPTVVRYGAVPGAVLIGPSSEHQDRGGDPERQEVALDDLAAHVSESGNPSNQRQLTSAEVSLPRALLSGGLALVDTPGVGGLRSVHSLSTLTALPTADAVLFVSDASQEYTAPEMDFLSQAMRVCPNIACVLTKIDLYPQWRQVAALNRIHLDAVAEGIALYPVSSDLRMTATRLEDGELNAESGFPALVEYLRRDIVGSSATVRRRSVTQDLLSASEHLRLALQSELSVLVDPRETPRIIAEMEAAKARAMELGRRSSRWQVTLNDGVSDLISDMEHDLRDRMRAIQRDAEQSIDSDDPGPHWEAFIDWMEQRVAAAVSDTFVWSSERAQWLSTQVADHFVQDEVPLPVLSRDDIEDVLEPVEIIPLLDSGKLNPLEKLLIGLRGSYGGVLMVGLITSILGMALINPFSIAAGVLIGSKVYKDDKDNRLKKRQAEAKTLVRRQVDEVIFQVGKQLKDRLRLVQRATRDHFTEIAEEHVRSLNDSVVAAQKAASTFSAEREGRMKELRSELASVDALRDEALSVRDALPVQSARQAAPPALAASQVQKAVA